MDSNEAEAALESVNRIQSRLAERAKWAPYRHAMSGLASGLLIAALTYPSPTRTAMIVAGMALVCACILDDRRRHGMFISSWQIGATRPLTIALTVFVLTMVGAGLFVRINEISQPVGLILGMATFGVCTVASVMWERIYRADLLRQGRP